MRGYSDRQQPAGDLDLHRLLKAERSQTPIKSLRLRKPHLPRRRLQLGGVSDQKGGGSSAQVVCVWGPRCVDALVSTAVAAEVLQVTAATREAKVARVE